MLGFINDGAPHPEPWLYATANRRLSLNANQQNLIVKIITYYIHDDKNNKATKADGYVYSGVFA